MEAYEAKVAAMDPPNTMQDKIAAMDERLKNIEERWFTQTDSVVSVGRDVEE